MTVSLATVFVVVPVIMVVVVAGVVVLCVGFATHALRFVARSG